MEDSLKYWLDFFKFAFLAILCSAEKIGIQFIHWIDFDQLAKKAIVYPFLGFIFLNCLEGVLGSTVRKFATKKWKNYITRRSLSKMREANKQKDNEKT